MKRRAETNRRAAGVPRAPWVAALMLTLAGCVHSEPPPEPVAIVAGPKPTRSPETPGELLSVLDKIAPSGTSAGDAVEDVRFMLDAIVQESRGDQAGAVKSWYAALGQAQGRLGRRAFSGWLKAYTKALGTRTDADVLTKLILAETANGAYSPFMQAHQLTNPATLKPVLLRTVPDAVLPAGPLNPTVSQPPLVAGIPKTDPLLAATAATYCRKNGPEGPWMAWALSLPPAVNLYWQARTQECLGNAGAALTAYQSALPLLNSQASTAPLALETASHIVSLERSRGDRAAAADAYRDLMSAWAHAGLNAQTLGLTAESYWQRRINDTLWAARYRVLVGDLENAKLYAEQALSLETSFHVDLTQPSTATTHTLADLRAEAYQVLAYQVAVEKGEYETALSLNTLALQSPDLSPEWRDRFQWFNGLYAYLDNNFDAAIRSWVGLLRQTHDESLKPQLYFWLSRAYARQGQAVDSQAYYQALVEQFPLSYYAIVGPAVAGFKSTTPWQLGFAPVEALRDRLRDSRSLGLDALRRDPKLAVSLLRAETLVRATGERPSEWTQVAVEDLESIARKELDPTRQTSAFVYISRLHYAAQNYPQAIRLTTELGAQPRFWRLWPEQMLVAFPEPYADIYLRRSLDTGVEAPELYAISRQESSFNATIRSGAGAIGLMQLIPPTAQRLAKEAGLNDAATRLTAPEANVTLGSLYLKKLNMQYKGFEAAVYGAYNAGEFAVDGWLARRAQTDPLLWVELVPFGETKSYIRNVWRNRVIYHFLGESPFAVMAPRPTKRLARDRHWPDKVAR